MTSDAHPLSSFLDLRLQDPQDTWAAIPKKTQASVIAALEDPALNAVSLGKEHMFTAAEAIVWAAAAGLEVAARAAAVAQPLTNPNNIRPLIRKVSIESS